MNTLELWRQLKLRNIDPPQFIIGDIIQAEGKDITVTHEYLFELMNKMVIQYDMEHQSNTGNDILYYSKIK